VQQLRVDAAQLMLEQGQHPIEVVATESGFADRERRAFLRAFGHPPLAVRRAGRVHAPA
jgi:transcriptional regulator GlxA family with amidase domain